MFTFPQPRQRYGGYDEVCQRAAGRVRLCNWVRFVAPALHFTPQVNMVASRVRGESRATPTARPGEEERTAAQNLCSEPV
ncbi:hypothetical protein E2C01_091280 [Portunus trituberculatus]|uniref:Uncharacterized protein n=1 Tax=Portunus trituberculatus TaxID=210409 RepID=A0A5B7JUL1_PORTR|nr:hypothetical protein [Portunus trituberculatus]